MSAEIRCDACNASFRYWGADRVEQLAQSMGWHVQDITLCPSCADLWVSSNPDLYGRHASNAEDSSGYWFFIAAYIGGSETMPKRRPTGCHRFGYSVASIAAALECAA